MLVVAAGFLLGWGCSPAGKARKTAGETAGAHHDEHAAAASPAVAAADHDDCGHRGCEASAKEANGCGSEHGRTGTVEDLTPEAIEAHTCGHAPRTIDCDECRYEVGVVKLQKATAAALVKTAKVQESELVRHLRLTGEVAFDATAVVDIRPLASGNVVAVKARLGQEVRAGEALALIHSVEIGEAKAAYLEALTATEIAATERERQQAIGMALTKLLDALPKGGSAQSLNSGPLGEWKSKLVGAAARLDQARIVSEREKVLVGKDASSKAELDAARYELQTAEADYVALVEEAQLSLRLELLRAENEVRQANARLTAAEQRLHVLSLSQAAIEQIGKTNENGRFAELEIRAPRAGTITALDVTVGRYVDSTQSLCTIADLSTVWVWCDLYERDLAGLHEFMSQKGQPAASVEVPAFADPFAGVVDLLGSEVNEATRTIKVRVQVPAPQGRLRPGMFATVRVALPTGRTVTCAPRDAILTDEGRAFVFQQWKDDLWLRRHVVLGEVSGDTVQIVSGVAPGAELVVGGGFMLKSDVLRAKMGAGCAD